MVRRNFSNSKICVKTLISIDTRAKLWYNK